MRQSVEPTTEAIVAVPTIHGVIEDGATSQMAIPSNNLNLIEAPTRKRRAFEVVQTNCENNQKGGQELSEHLRKRCKAMQFSAVNGSGQGGTYNPEDGPTPGWRDGERAAGNVRQTGHL